MSTLIHVQKENSPKILPTRPAGLRTAAEKQKGKSDERKEAEKEDPRTKKDSKRKGREGKRETRPGTEVSTLVHVQKENSPKILPTRPAGLRTAAEKEKGKEKRRNKNSTTEPGVVEWGA